MSPNNQKKGLVEVGYPQPMTLIPSYPQPPNGVLENYRGVA